MNTTAISLVFFTLISQMCVGAFVLQEILIPYAHNDKAVVSKWRAKLLGNLLVFIILALFLSFFHLGKPLHAIFSLHNLQASWLSREILMISVFAFLLFVYAIAFKRIRGNKTWLKITGILGIITGILLIFVMSKIYTLPVIPAWNTLATPLEFYIAGFLLGSLLLLIISKNVLVQKEAMKDAFFSGRIRILLILTSVLIIADLMISFYDMLTHTDLAGDTILIFSLVKTLLHLISLFLLFSMFRQFNAGRFASSIRGISLILVLIAIAEIIGRYAFYLSFERMGM